MMFYHREPRLGMLRRFRCRAVLTRGKDTVRDGALDNRGISGIVVGIGESENRKCYKVWNPTNNRVYYGMHVQFDETDMPFRKDKEETEQADLEE
eukprot:1566774-Rhodomonas_salina.1